MAVPPPAPNTAAPTTDPIAPTPELSRAALLASTCPPLIPEMILVLAEVLGQMMVDKLSPVVVPTLVKLFGDDKTQEEPAPLPTISLPSILLVWLQKVSDLRVLAGFSLLPPPLLLLLHYFPLPLLPFFH